ncbi:glycerophosphodiester phosphodiesterase [Endozoicomonas sp. OPT23]|uniref:glycerophosphodiester phosphodiesterase n=1 Tax=Endozoicomonas sp. OPT23 TaxID=2072845 RepID=UPI00129BB180|nr:glycerophosphodiester phosphodiesterase [Endozoicomonas sp. OPT23]MRI33447.1 glycerophosphodiester phosphodiesterase [Endozoicomonas sp. OPT23]
MWKKLVLLLALVIGGLYFVPPVNYISEHAYYRDKAKIDVIAHRAGHGLKPDNTADAAALSHKLGALIEMDIHSSKDGHLIVRHDDTVNATTNGYGPVKEKTLEELKALDAGYMFDPNKDQSYPYREVGITIPTFQEIVDVTPGARYVIEIKQERPSIARKLCKSLKDNNIDQKAIIGSFKHEALEEFRAICPQVATSMSPEEVKLFVGLQKVGLSHLLPVTAQALQVPLVHSDLEIVTPSFIEDAQSRGLKVEVWTINETSEMVSLIDDGVDGIITDYPDRLNKLL